MIWATTKKFGITKTVWFIESIKSHRRREKVKTQKPVEIIAMTDNDEKAKDEVVNKNISC